MSGRVGSSSGIMKAECFNSLGQIVRIECLMCRHAFVSMPLNLKSHASTPSLNVKELWPAPGSIVGQGEPFVD